MDDPHEFAGNLTNLLAHLIRAALLADDQAVSARRDALAAHETLRAAVATADLSAIRLDGLWSLAKGRVQTPELDDHPLQASRQLTASCPIALGDLLGPSLATAELEERIRAAAATG